MWGTTDEWGVRTHRKLGEPIAAAEAPCAVAEVLRSQRDSARSRRTSSRRDGQASHRPSNHYRGTCLSMSGAGWLRSRVHRTSRRSPRTAFTWNEGLVPPGPSASGPNSDRDAEPAHVGARAVRGQIVQAQFRIAPVVGSRAPARTRNGVARAAGGAWTRQHPRRVGQVTRSAVSVQRTSRSTRLESARCSRSSHQLSTTACLKHAALVVDATYLRPTTVCGRRPDRDLCRFPLIVESEQCVARIAARSAEARSRRSSRRSPACAEPSGSRAGVQ